MSILPATVREAAVDAGYALGWAGLRGLPEPLARRQFDALADVIHRRGGRGVQRLRANLARVLGPERSEEELERTTRAGMRSYLRYWYETFRLPRLAGGSVDRYFACDNFDILAGARDAGHGVVVALTHSGNWDLAGAWLAQHGMPFTTVVERLKPERLFNRFVQFRESLGMEVIPLSGAQAPPSRLLTDRLREGGVLCLLADRDLTASGIEVSFFGGTAKLPGGPARLALATGAALLPTDLWFDTPRTARALVHPAIPASNEASMTQRLADTFAADIARHPQDWHMLQRVWLD